MYKLHLTILFLFLIKVACAQPVGFKKISSETDFRNGLAQTSQATNSISSDFIQEKNLSLLDEKVVSKGIFRFKKENKVRMEYTHPFKYLMVINGDKVTIKDQQKSNSFSAGSNKLFSIINTIIIDCVKGTALDNKDFTNKLFESEKNYLVELIPVKKDLKQFFTVINVYLDKKDYSVIKIDMKEPSGDNTLITFTNKEINATIQDAEFNIK
jgi:outer membrane lipoprotein-sorting protein